MRSSTKLQDNLYAPFWAIQFLFLPSARLLHAFSQGLATLQLHSVQHSHDLELQQLAATQMAACLYTLGHGLSTSYSSHFICINALNGLTVLYERFERKPLGLGVSLSRSGCHSLIPTLYKKRPIEGPL